MEAYFFFLTLRELEDEREEEDDLREELEEDLDLEVELILFDPERLELRLDEELTFLVLLLELSLAMRLTIEFDFRV